LRLIDSFIRDERGASRNEAPPAVRAGLVGLLLVVVVVGLMRLV
jgi:Flp pilus assembly pilin Flp